MDEERGLEAVVGQRLTGVRRNSKDYLGDGDIFLSLRFENAVVTLRADIDYDRCLGVEEHVELLSDESWLTGREMS